MGEEKFRKKGKMWKISIKKSPSQMVGVGGEIPIGGIGDEIRVSIRLLSSLTRLGASLLRSERAAPHYM